ncbi:hypothetical protein E2C01_036111 [Portunus trituberculatus]|uniref:Uncharacterized protein n=1 Tax=Portunus trituberculatus TaxID=210409 RepID=A0A5B7FB55_PORTR|nr:hypothetical protein [Portunus trituberculatus]
MNTEERDNEGNVWKDGPKLTSTDPDQDGLPLLFPSSSSSSSSSFSSSSSSSTPLDLNDKRVSSHLTSGGQRSVTDKASSWFLLHSLPHLLP